MIAFDPILTKFVAENVVTIGVVYKILKGLARITSWAWDDSVVSLFFGAFKAINPTVKTDEKEEK